jgi:hypothetical protein
MSWLKPENIQPSDYDPQTKVARFMEQHGVVGRRILEALNGVDPLHCLFDNNPDEYVGEARKIITLLGERDLTLLSVPEITDLVRESFGTSVTNGFVETSDVDAIAQKIIAQR